MADLNATPSGERVHIGFFGLRNTGKSSLVNAITGQDLAVVSDVRGTTTDLVSKAMELLPIGPVVIIDTPGMDDEGTLGELRVKKARQALRKCHMAVLVSDCTHPLQQAELELIDLFKARKMPYAIASNKSDLLSRTQLNGIELASNEMLVSAMRNEKIHEFKELIARLAKDMKPEKNLIADLLSPDDTVVLVIPIDESAPRGRLILPQQMTIRDILEAGATCSTCQPAQLATTLESLKQPPRMIVTDSQAFEEVSAIVPDDVLLTSFSILMARYRGNLDLLRDGALEIAQLEDGDRVLVSEGCTHHRQCEDIGTVKIPRWIKAHSNANPEFEFTAGGKFPDDLSPYALIVHCGGCMLNNREMEHRMASAREAGVPMVNYGLAIAQMNGILQRSMEPFE